MSAQTDRWKGVERRLAKKFGTVRVSSGDKTDEADIRGNGWCAEVKSRKTAVPKTVLDYLLQAERQRRHNAEFAFAIGHLPGTKLDNAVVYIRLKEFVRLMREAGYVREVDGPTQDT